MSKPPINTYTQPPLIRQTIPPQKTVPLSQRTWFVILMLVLVFPVGFYLLWSHPRWMQNTKIVASAIWAVLAVFSLTSKEKSPVIAEATSGDISSSDLRFTNITPARARWIQDIRDGMKYGVKASNTGYMVKAKNHANVYFVAAQITGEGIPKGEWAIWAVGGSSSLMVAADSMSSEFSQYPRGDKTKAKVWASDDEEGTNLKLYVSDKMIHKASQ